MEIAPGTGLSDRDAHDRLRRDGPNRLPAASSPGIVSRFATQLREPMALLLGTAATVSWLVLGEAPESIAIGAIVVVNAVIATAQETKARRALDALASLETPIARVIRSGQTTAIPAEELVQNDLVLIAAGDRVPADLRLIEANDLHVDEAALTGESLPVGKDASMDGARSASMGTLVTRGSGTGVVSATGPHTQLGRIAARLTEARRPTPLQEELRRLTAALGAVAVAAAAVTFGATALTQGITSDSLQRTFLTVVALAVAAVPEGLATVVTVSLAVGVTRMAQRGAIVRRLPAVETLGTTTVIATDKTGTLTQNRMAVVGTWFPEDDAVRHELAREIAALCNDATSGSPLDDPLESALLEWVGESSVESLRSHHPRLSSRPFDPDRKMMSVVVDGAGSARLLVKGAPERVVDACDGVHGSRDALTPASARPILDAADELAGRGLKVLALATGPPESAASERGLSFVGLVALGDPIRPEAAAAVTEARAAGVDVLMITGDHPATALAIAGQVGIDTSGVMTGQELDRSGLPDDPLVVGIYARVTPDHKLAVVDALQERGEVVAVTGDGVNDAPALHRAHIGVAMGAVGTDVAREASDLVITDDNLATIVAAMKEGRGIYDNIRRVVSYLVAANIAEITVFIGALFLFPDLAIPLLPLQLLWINLVTDGLPAVALGIDPVSPSVMQRPPRRRREHLLERNAFKQLLLQSVLMAAACLGVLAIARHVWDEPWGHARALMFVTLALTQLVFALVIRRPERGSSPAERSLRASIDRFFSNRWLLLGVLGGMALQIVLVTWAPARELFDASVFSAREWALAIAASILPHAVFLISARGASHTRRTI